MVPQWVGEISMLPTAVLELLSASENKAHLQDKENEV